MYSPPIMLLPPAVANEPFICVVPDPPKITAPDPGVPITVFGPITSVVPAATLLLVIEKLPADEKRRLPVLTNGRLIVWVPVTPDPTLIAVRLPMICPG